MPGWWWVGWEVKGPFEDSPYRGQELLIWGKERRSFDALYWSYKIQKSYNTCVPYHRKRVPGRHCSVLYFPIEKGSPEDTCLTM